MLKLKMCTQSLKADFIFFAFFIVVVVVFIFASPFSMTTWINIKAKLECIFCLSIFRLWMKRKINQIRDWHIHFPNNFVKRLTKSYIRKHWNVWGFQSSNRFLFIRVIMMKTICKYLAFMILIVFSADSTILPYSRAICLWINFY